MSSGSRNNHSQWANAILDDYSNEPTSEWRGTSQDYYPPEKSRGYTLEKLRDSIPFISLLPDHERLLWVVNSPAAITHEEWLLTKPAYRDPFTRPSWCHRHFSELSLEDQEFVQLTRETFIGVYGVYVAAYLMALRVQEPQAFAESMEIVLGAWTTYQRDDDMDKYEMITREVIIALQSNFDLVDCSSGEKIPHLITEGWPQAVLNSPTPENLSIKAMKAATENERVARMELSQYLNVLSHSLQGIGGSTVYRSLGNLSQAVLGHSDAVTPILNPEIHWRSELFIAFALLAEEYNVEWALAAVEWK